jgi:hypothetical protein
MCYQLYILLSYSPSSSISSLHSEIERSLFLRVNEFLNEWPDALEIILGRLFERLSARGFSVFLDTTGELHA